MADRSEAEPSPQPSRPRLGPKRWLAATLAVVLVAVVGFTAWKWRHPDESFRVGYGIGMTREVGFTIWTTLARSDRAGDTPITFSGLEPIFRVDGAAVKVEYVICELNPETLAEDHVGGFGYGLPTREMHRYCASTRPAEGGTLDPHAGVLEELLVGVAATQPGRTVITGHHVTFGVGWQRGSTDIPVEIKLKARPDR